MGHLSVSQPFKSVVDKGCCEIAFTYAKCDVQRCCSGVSDVLFSIRRARNVVFILRG